MPLLQVVRCRTGPSARCRPVGHLDLEHQGVLRSVRPGRTRSIRPDSIPGVPLPCSHRRTIQPTGSSLSTARPWGQGPPGTRRPTGRRRAPPDFHRCCSSRMRPPVPVRRPRVLRRDTLAVDPWRRHPRSPAAEILYFPPGRPSQGSGDHSAPSISASTASVRTLASSASKNSSAMLVLSFPAR